MNPNRLVRFLKKDPAEFTKEDIICFCEANGVEMVNFRYAAEDGKLKTLNFVITSRDHLDTILSEVSASTAATSSPLLRRGAATST
jgi:hypothetical protein